MDRSWFQDQKFKEDICGWWRSRPTFGSALDKLTAKLRELRHHLLDIRRQLRTSRSQDRETAIARVLALDVIEDSRPLKAEEVQERKACQNKVVEVDLRIEMDWRQRSR